MKKRLFNRFRRWSRQEKIILTITTVVFALYAITLVYPFFYTFMNSFKTEEQFYDNVFSLPSEWHFENYAWAMQKEFKATSIVGMFWNSFWQTVMATGVGMICCSLMAYVVARYNFKFLKLLYAVAIFSMVIPIVGNTPAMYKLLYATGIADNPAAIWVIWANGFGFAFLVLYGFFKSVSWSYAEAAFVDGASHFRVFIQVMMPQAMPAVVSMIILSAVGFWNDYMTPYLYLPSYPTVAVGLFELKSTLRWELGGVPVYYALMLISLIPIIIVFVAFQKTIMENVSTGGLKG